MAHPFEKGSKYEPMVSKMEERLRYLSKVKNIPLERYTPRTGIPEDVLQKHLTRTFPGGLSPHDIVPAAGRIRESVRRKNRKLLLERELGNDPDVWREALEKDRMRAHDGLVALAQKINPGVSIWDLKEKIASLLKNLNSENRVKQVRAEGDLAVIFSQVERLGLAYPVWYF